MAYKNHIFILLFTLFTASFTIDPSHAAECASGGEISVYWGQNYAEGTLESACDTGNYNIVILEYLILHDDGSTPELDLASHCTDCTVLESEIQGCQSKGIKVLLSIGGDLPTATQASKRSSTISSSSQDVVSEVAEYIYENFLSNQSGPLGKVALDGIDFTPVPEGTNIKWEALARAINASTTERKICLSASPQCVYPDYYLDSAIQTGLFDYIWVEFYHNSPCEYSNGSPESLFKAWDTWTSSVLPNNSVFLEVLAAENEYNFTGYISPDVLKSQILPYIKQADNYGGVMVWDRFYDSQTNYSGQIKDSVPKAFRSVFDGAVSRNFFGLLSQSL